MLGKDAILHFFEREGVTTLFHLPGIHTLPLDEALIRAKVNVIRGRHESNLSFMADGYARATGRPGVLVVTPGPGLGNAVSGCMEAHGDHVPLVVLHIDTGRKEIGKGILHELEEPHVIFTHFAKKTFFVSRTDELIPALDRSFRAATAGRKGPVVVSIPYQFLQKEVPFEIRGHDGEDPDEPDLRGLEEALQGRIRPVIIGGGALMSGNLGTMVDEMCTRHKIPFFSTTSGKGIVSEKNTYAFGNIMQKGIAKDIVSASDIVIAIGTRLRDVDAKRRGLKLKDFIHIDSDRTWMEKNYPTLLGISGNMTSSVEGLSSAFKDRRFDWDLETLKEAERKERKNLEKKSLGFRTMKLIRDAIPVDGTTVWDLNLIAYWAEYYFPVLHQRSFIMPRGISPLFYALPGAMGAKLGRPAQPCLAVCGDGSALPTLAELATIKQYNIPLVVLVYNNSSFGILEDYMVSSSGIEGSMALTNPDFVKLARAFGIKAKKATTLTQLKRIFLQNISWDEPFLIEFEFPLFPPPWRA
jgi:acetolactate synthase-1/2/3 large subunit